METSRARTAVHNPPVGTEGDRALEDMVEDPVAAAAFDRVGVELLHGDLRTVLKTLGPREEQVVLLRFGLLDGRGIGSGCRGVTGRSRQITTASR